jgi:hypothetical protein
MDWPYCVFLMTLKRLLKRQRESRSRWPSLHSIPFSLQRNTETIKHVDHQLIYRLGESKQRLYLDRNVGCNGKIKWQKKIFSPRHACYVRWFTWRLCKMQSHVSTTPPTLSSSKYSTVLRENLSTNRLHNVERQGDCEWWTRQYAYSIYRASFWPTNYHLL